jgi:hypothetical protein
MNGKRSSDSPSCLSRGRLVIHIHGSGWEWDLPVRLGRTSGFEGDLLS